jgi:hypothetical protein
MALSFISQRPKKYIQGARHKDESGCSFVCKRAQSTLVAMHLKNNHARRHDSEVFFFL